MYYRTRTYIAGDWDGDKVLIDKLYEWDKKDNLLLSFSDAHKLTQARDGSLPCSIKKSLAERLSGSKTFLLVVGKYTSTVTKGSCRYCKSYSSYLSRCNRGHSLDMRSFVQYECEKAVKDHLNIIVLYNFASVNKLYCPDILKNVGKHIKAYCRGMDGKLYWNYSEIRDAIIKS
jgi:hypothetical protein